MNELKFDAGPPQGSTTGPSQGKTPLASDLPSQASEKLSIVIPVCNESSVLEDLLNRLDPFSMDEIIVADCGSCDGSVAFLQAWANGGSGRYRRMVLSAPRGRGSQMNAGAKRARSELFLFLHADTHLPTDGIDLVRETMNSRDVVGGAFRLHIDSKHPFLKWVSWMANLRSVYWALPYGDQAYFVRRSVFESLGGYPALPLMEDVAFIGKLKKAGRIVLLKKAVSTSARRWQRRGHFFTSFQNMFLLCLYFLGVSPGRLAKWYDSSHKT